LASVSRPIFQSESPVTEQNAHVVQFYSQDSFLLDELASFVGTGLLSGNVALVIATRSHREGLAQRLISRGLDLSQAIQWGRYVALDATETLARFMVNGMPDAAKFQEYLGEALDAARLAGEGKDPSVVAFGEMVALLWAESNYEAAIRLEQLWNELGHTRAFQLRCAYPITHFDQKDHAPGFLKVCSEHSAVIPDESYTALANNADRFRLISELQQKAEALESEVTERKRVEEELFASQEALRKSHEELETRVKSRTKELADAEIRLRELSRRLLNLRDEERRRLARELHDSTGQTLAALELSLVMLEGANLEPNVAEKIKDAVQLADQALQEIRTLSYLLHPPMLDEAGLVLALEWYVDGFAQRSRMKIDLDLPRQYQRLPQEMELAIFRIVQESLTNVHKHAGSSSVSIGLSIDDDYVHLAIADAGKGMSPQAWKNGKASAGVGIRGMRERALHLNGELEICSRGSGTTVKVKLPIRKKNPFA
jgi:signal transduction histidine kinase